MPKRDWLSAFGIRRRSPAPEFPVECDEGDRRILTHVMMERLSMTSPARLFATALACRHVTAAGVPGAFVECGVWRGGNALIAADIFRRAGGGRKVYLYDTFAGMTPPTEHDFDDCTQVSAREKFARAQRRGFNGWCYASLAEVKENFRKAGLLDENVIMVEGDVMDTLSHAENLPDAISVLRLDTDWYESTRRELEVLWPRLSKGGILMIDDYGHWNGARKAAEEYFAGRPRPFFHYIDYTGRLAVKT